MKIAEQIRKNQDVKEMTRSAIKILEQCGEDVTEERTAFLTMYGEEVDNKR